VGDLVLSIGNGFAFSVAITADGLRAGETAYRPRNLLLTL
jgi:hypothetical protein